MIKLKIIFLIPLIFLFFLLYFIPIQAQTTYNWKVDPAIAFKLPAYNTIIKFNNYFYLNSFTWDSYNASMITFNGIQIAGGDPLSSFGISVKNANATIVYLNTGGVGKIVLSAPSGTESILTFIYPSNYPASIAITKSGVRQVMDSSYYLKDEATFSSHSAPAILLLENEKKIKIKNVHASDVEVDIYWMSAQLPLAPSGLLFPPKELFKLFLKFLTKSGEMLMEGTVKIYQGTKLIAERQIIGGKASITDLKEGDYTIQAYDKYGNLVGSEEIYVDKDMEKEITIQFPPPELTREQLFWKNLWEFFTNPPIVVILIFVIPILIYILSKVKWEALEKEIILWEFWRSYKQCRD